MNEIESRVSSLEEWRREQTTVSAVDAEKRKHIDNRFDNIETGIKRLDGHFSRIVWLIVTAIVAALMAFIIRGGLTGA